MTSRLKGRIDRLSGGPVCPTCGHGSNRPIEYKITWLGLPLKHGMIAAEESPRGPERCPACGRWLRHEVKVLGLRDLPRAAR